MNDLEKRLKKVDDDFYLSPPDTVHLFPSYACGRNCLYCDNRWVAKKVHGSYARAQKIGMSTSRIKSILTEAKHIKVKLVQLSGGEPFLREDIYEVIQHGVSLGLTLFPVTRHAFAPAEIEKLRDAGLKHIGVSLDSLSDRVNRKLHGGSAIKNEMLKGIELLLAAGITPSILTVMSRLNYLEYRGFVRRMKRMGIRYFSPMIISPGSVVMGKGVMGLDRALKVSGRTMERCIQELDRLKEERAPWDIPKLFREACPANNVAYIDPAGFLTYCVRTPDLYLGNVRNRSLMEVWLSKRRKEIMRPSRRKFKGTKCFECDKFDLCSRVGRCYYSTIAMRQKTIYQPEPRLCRWFDV